MSDDTAVKISLLFKDVSNDNYFSKYSSHILASIIILCLIIGLITYYKIKNQLGSYKYRRDAKTGELLWPDEKCLPYILPIAGHIDKLPGETIAGATDRNFKECVESMVKDKNNEYINPFNEIVAAALALSGTVMAGLGFVLNSVISLAEYIKNQFGGLNNILSKMKTEIKSIFQNDIFTSLSNSYRGIYNVAGKHTLFLTKFIKNVVKSIQIDYYRLFLYYLYYQLLRQAYTIAAGISAGTEAVAGFFTGNPEDGETSAGYYYKIYKSAEKELREKLILQQTFLTAHSTPLAPHIAGTDADTTKVMDQKYTLFSSDVYTEGWHDYKSTEKITFIQPMSLVAWENFAEWRNTRFNKVKKNLQSDIDFWDVPRRFIYKDQYFTEQWYNHSIPNHVSHDKIEKSLKDLFKNHYGAGDQATAQGAEMSSASKKNVSLEAEFITLPLTEEEEEEAAKECSGTPYPTIWPMGRYPGIVDNKVFHAGGGDANAAKKKHIFVGTYNQLRKISKGDEVGYYSDRRDKVLGLMKQQAINGKEALKEIEEYRGNQYKFHKQLHKCITITYTDETIPSQIYNTLKELGRGGNSDKSNQWIDADPDKNQVHISNITWNKGVGAGGVGDKALYPFPANFERYSQMNSHMAKFGKHWPPLYFRGYLPDYEQSGEYADIYDDPVKMKKYKALNPFYDDPIWFSSDLDFGMGERTAFLFDREKNKIEVTFPDKDWTKSEQVANPGYYNGKVRFNLQRYDFTRDGWWGNEIKLIDSWDTGRRVSGRYGGHSPLTASVDGEPWTQSKNLPTGKCPHAKRGEENVGRANKIGYMDYTHPNAAYCRVFGVPTIGSGAILTDEDHAHLDKDKQHINDAGLGDLDLGTLNAGEFSFMRKYALKPGKEANSSVQTDYYTVNEMEGATNHWVSKSREGVNESAVKSLKDIVYELRVTTNKAAPGHRSEFYVHEWEPTLPEKEGRAVVDKICNRTGGGGLRNWKDNKGRFNEIRQLKEKALFFGQRAPDGRGDTIEAPRDDDNDDWTTSEFISAGWGNVTFGTVWWKQTEKVSAKNAILEDQVMTDVCEPGWEFNLGRHETTKTVKIDNRNGTHTCEMNNMTLYSQLQFCFGINSPIFLKNGKKVYIQDVKLGDILSDGSIVTSTTISEIGANEIYMLPCSSLEEPILVSNKHKVELITYTDGLREKSFVQAEQHPEAVKCDNYEHNILYCVCTNTSRIVINDYVFQDWNEIGAVDYYELFNFFNKTPYFKNLNKFGIFLDNDVKEMIHNQLASGLWGKTPIRLHNKSVCNLDEIKIGDVLTSGDRVLSIIKTKCDDVDIYKHNIEGKTFYGSKNISYYPKTNTTDDNNSVDLLLKDISSKCAEGLPGDCEKVLYHFITNSGSIPINGIKFAFHNHALQHILSI
jgi:hypothetical protein